MGNLLYRDPEENESWGEMQGQNAMKHRGRRSRRDGYDSDSGTVSRFHPDHAVMDTPGDRPSLSPEAALKCSQKRDLPRPKRAKSPFNCFVQEQMGSSRKGGKEPADLNRRMSALSSQWKSMSDNDKIPYLRVAAEDRNRYASEKAKFEKDKSQIIKRPLNGYIVFMREFRRRQKGTYKDAKELVREGAKAWKRLSSQEKMAFNQESLSDSNRYAQERLQWCNKTVRPRRDDTRLGKRTAGQKDEPMDSSDQEADGMN